jgi:serine/threonine protein kinase/Tfp pilus assembly protein PilF
MLNEQIGQYRITGRLGQGGMGEIFSARDEKLNRTVAVKFIDARMDSDASRRLFLREARAAAALDHPFICTVHDVLEHKGQPVIVMERVEGETLQARISRGALSVEQVVQVALEIAEALAAAHARGIVHRDVKSANIMITPGGHVKVMDFGLALMLMSAPDDQTAHRSEELRSRVAGTLPYMAPEVLRGESATPASDLYALGVVMFEMATGRRPFAGKTDAVLISEILEHSPAAPRQVNQAVPRALENLIVKLLSKDPVKRPTAGEVIEELRTIAAPKRRRTQSLAVLPFRALTSDPENAHLGLALADATTSELALVRSLVVRPTSAILRYHDAASDSTEAARELGVDFAVTGTFQRAGSRLRVSVQLVSTSEERPLWSTKIDTSIDDIFAMQDEVSRKIVEALQVELTTEDERRLTKRPQASGDALDLYLKGRVALLHETVQAVNQAIEYLERALQIDPRNAAAWIALADAYCRLAFTWDPEGGWYERAKEMSNRALALDPDIPEGHYIRARLAWTPQGGFQHEYAIREIVAALAERPNLNEGFDWLATILFHVGLVEEARIYYAHALVINPGDVLARTHKMMGEWLTGNYAATIKAAAQAPEEFETSWAAYMESFAHLRMGNLSNAEKTIESAARRFPANVLFQSARAILAALQKNESAATLAIDRTLQNRKAYGHFHHAELDIACTLAILGRNDEAIDHLTSAVRSGFPCLAAVENDPLLASLRSHPRYLDLIQELRQQRDHFAGVFAGVRRMIST